MAGRLLSMRAFLIEHLTSRSQLPNQGGTSSAVLAAAATGDERLTKLAHRLLWLLFPGACHGSLNPAIDYGIRIGGIPCGYSPRACASGAPGHPDAARGARQRTGAGAHHAVAGRLPRSRARHRREHRAARLRDGRRAAERRSRRRLRAGLPHVSRPIHRYPDFYGIRRVPRADLPLPLQRRVRRRAPTRTTSSAICRASRCRSRARCTRIDYNAQIGPRRGRGRQPLHRRALGRAVARGQPARGRGHHQLHHRLRQLVRARRLQEPRLHEDRRTGPGHRLQLRPASASRARSSPGVAPRPTTPRAASDRLHRIWFHDLSAGPELWTDNWNINDADMDGNGVLDYRMPPVWEYGNPSAGHLPPVRRSVRRPRRSWRATWRIDLLFTSSPLYKPAISPPDLPSSRAGGHPPVSGRARLRRQERAGHHLREDQAGQAAAAQRPSPPRCTTSRCAARRARDLPVLRHRLHRSRAATVIRATATGCSASRSATCSCYHDDKITPVHRGRRRLRGAGVPLRRHRRAHAGQPAGVRRRQLA